MRGQRDQTCWWFFSSRLKPLLSAFIFLSDVSVSLQPIRAQQTETTHFTVNVGLMFSEVIAISKLLYINTVTYHYNKDHHVIVFSSVSVYDAAFTERSEVRGQTLSSSSWLLNLGWGRRYRPSLYFWVMNSLLCSGEASQSSSSDAERRAAQKSLARSFPSMMNS